MTIAKRFFSIATSVLLTLGAAQGQTLPRYYPQTFQRIGTVDEIDTNRQVMVISDQPYRIASQLTVRTLYNVNAGLAGLQTGDRVGLAVQGKGARRTVQEIWVLPPGYREADAE